MKQRRIGQSDLTVFPIGLGTMGMSEFYGQPDEQESIKTLHTAIEKGVNFIDTADMYGIGKNEELLHKALHDRWDKVVLATKFGFEREPGTGRRVGVNGKPDYVKKACEASLKRLGRDTIDLYYLHRVDPETPIEDTIGAMAELVKEGKVRYVGISEASGDTIKKAHAVHPITAIQSEYSLWSQDVEETTLPTCRALGIGFVAYSPLGRGFLTGSIRRYEDLDKDDYRRNSPRFMGDNFQNNLDLVKKVEQIAQEKGCSSSQLALAWLLHQGDDIFPIPGTTKAKHLLTNIDAVNVNLTQDDLQQLGNVMKDIHGDRYDENGMRMVNV
ncbi:aldo/keto reductase [Pontibacter sp. E15-1]|uniref:aldo/keto reductase n=1 Tax=Pontibacter sp. E15-1 TaxID=2919918 RepID=UPI001F4FD85D|nr:aldo/keto reductase [Pontibacter sp. E15-1]MCJ8164653.1 aldo/keto reductase [Pontibacter sp. E15-1]